MGQGEAKFTILYNWGSTKIKKKSPQNTRFCLKTIQDFLIRETGAKGDWFFKKQRATTGKNSEAREPSDKDTSVFPYTGV